MTDKSEVTGHLWDALYAIPDLLRKTEYVGVSVVLSSHGGWEIDLQRHRLSTQSTQASDVVEARGKLTPEYLAMSPAEKWGALTVHGLLGTDEPWIADMAETLSSLPSEGDGLLREVKATCATDYGILPDDLLSRIDAKIAEMGGEG